MKRANILQMVRSSASTALTAIVLMVGVPPFALSQSLPATPPAQGQTVQLQEVVITGTHILSPDAVSANPISVATAQEIAKTPATTIEQFVPNLPSLDFTNGMTAGDGDVGLGASFVGMRNLGPQRTLVLVNGQRFPFTDNEGAYDAVDLNNIPVAMIDKIEVLRDGASSIYGSDAIGGVINIITKQHFNGLQINGNLGESTYGDGLKDGIDILMGSNFERGNVLLNVGYDHQSAIPASAREWAVDEHPNAGYNAFPQISSTVEGANAIIGGNRWFFPSGLNSGVAAGNVGALGSTPYDNLGDGATIGGALPPGDIAIPAFGGVFWNYGPPNDIVNGLDRKYLDLTGHYDITNTLMLVVDGFYTSRTSTEFVGPTEAAPSTVTPAFPDGFYSAGFLPNGSCNPYNPTCGSTPAAQAAIDANYGITGPENVPIFTRRSEDGNRLFDDDVNTYRLHVGIQGELGSNYTYDVGYLYGVSDATNSEHNELNFLNFAQELGMVPCGPAPGCSLANFFGYDTLTPAQAQYLTYDNVDQSQYKLQLGHADVQGPLVRLPAGTLRAALGVQHRVDSMFDNPSEPETEGYDLIYDQPTSGSYDTNSAYAEFYVPLVANLPLLKKLTTTDSVRYDDYSTFGSATTYKLGLNWAVDDDFRIRGSHSTGFRAPQVKELYGGHLLVEPGGFDPCAPGGAYAGSPTCVSAITAVGGNPATVTPINQINVITGGNPALEPETSDQTTLGFVFTPQFISRLEASITFWNIFIDHEIGTLDPNAVLSDCYGNVPYVISQAQACALVGPRLQGTGDLGNVTLLNENLFNEHTDGVDFGLHYDFDSSAIRLPAWGQFEIRARATRLIEDNISGAGVTVERAGTFTNDYGWVRWKGVVSVGFASRDNWSVLWTSRYYGPLRNQDPTSACQYGSVPSPCGADPYDFPGNETGGVFYHDVSASYTHDGLLVTLGVSNLLNTSPPFLTPNAQENTMAAAGYDLFGRYLFLKLSLDLDGTH
ncbi:MAG: TonB-dependent receptor plug domain-containing protein [Steroidobacteraceae bacterium]